MPDPGFQLTPPFSGWGNGYQAPVFFNNALTLRPPYLLSQLGWATQSQAGHVYNLGLTWPGSDPGLDTSFQDACAAVARSPQTDPRTLAQSFIDAADPSVWDAIADAVSDKGKDLWTDVPGSRKKITTGEPAAIGKINPGSGAVQLNAPDELIAGKPYGVKTVSLGKKFMFVNSPDVHFYIILDKDALPDKKSLFLSGASIGIEGKTSSGDPLKLKFGAGRDEAGGGAAFFTIQIGPDFLAPSSRP